MSSGRYAACSSSFGCSQISEDDALWVDGLLSGLCHADCRRECRVDWDEQSEMTDVFRRSHYSHRVLQEHLGVALALHVPVIVRGDTIGVGHPLTAVAPHRSVSLK